MILREKSYHLGVDLTILEVRLCYFFHGLTAWELEKFNLINRYF